MMDESLERYSRQMRFYGIGEAGQRKLLDSRVTLCGCGALGTVLANALVRAGVGYRAHHRPRLHRDAQPAAAGPVRRARRRREPAQGRGRRAQAARHQLGVHVEPVVTDIDRTNILELCQDADLILDGTDNFEIRYLINDVAVKLGKPWVYGGCDRQPRPDDDDHARARRRACAASSRRRRRRARRAPARRPACWRRSSTSSPASRRRGAQDPDRATRHGQPRTDLRRRLGEHQRAHQDRAAAGQGRLPVLPAAAASSGSKASTGSQTTSLCGRNAVQVAHRVAGERSTSRRWPGTWR